MSENIKYKSPVAMPMFAKIIIPILCILMILGAIQNNYKLCGEPIYISYEYCKEYQLKQEETE